MLHSVPLGPLALPVAPLLLFAGVWLAAWVAGRWARHRGRLADGESPGDAIFHAAGWGLLCARLVHVGLHADLYLVQPLAMLDVRDGGWHAPSGWAAGVLWLMWQSLRKPAWRQALWLGAVAGGVLWSVVTLGLNPGTSRPDLPAVSLRSERDGSLQSLPELGAGQLRVINLWASWCGPCRQEMPMLASLQDTQTDVQFLFVNQGEPVHAVRSYLQRERLRLRQVWLDDSSALGPALGVSGLPATVFVNARGQVVDLHFGLISEPALLARLRALRESD